LLAVPCTDISAQQKASDGRIPPNAHQFGFLSNGSIKIGVDLRAGGGIGYFSGTRAESNLINIYDYGKYLGPDYYAGPVGFGNPHPNWPHWRWNPITPGDVYGHPSKVLRYTNDGKTLYVKTLPMQWALNNVPAESYFETWITLDGSAAHVWNRLVNSRRDRAWYGRQTQELPALLTVGRLYRVVSYDGLQPFTHAPLREFKNFERVKRAPLAHWTASENWAALLNDKDWGIGLYNPVPYTFAGSFRGKNPGTGGPFDPQAGFLAPQLDENFDHNIIFEFEYTLILGKIEQIRNYVYAHRRKDTRPDYLFEKNRQHWTYLRANDTEFPPKNGLQVILNNPRPIMVGPDQWWSAKDVSRLYIRAAHHTQPGTAQLFWRVPAAADTIRIAADKRTSPESSISFRFNADGKFHTYEIDLASAPTYRGTISGLRFDPTTRGQKDERVEIKFISWKNYEPGQPTIKVVAGRLKPELQPSR